MAERIVWHVLNGSGSIAEVLYSRPGADEARAALARHQAAAAPPVALVPRELPGRAQRGRARRRGTAGMKRPLVRKGSA